MASPLKRILSPKVLTPIFKTSPSLKSPSLTKNDCIPKLLRCENSVFQSSPKNIGFCPTIKITKDKSSKPLVINTPNKHSLLSNGLSSPHGVEILGKGSFGVVVKGIYKGNEVAVKIVKLGSQSTLGEENALQLSHQNVVKTFDVIWNYSGKYGLVLMEYIQSAQHLQSILDNKEITLTLQTIVQFALNICEGLQYIHSNNVLHLDLKPNNILVCDNSVCKLCDFGNSLKIDSVDHIFCHQGNVAYTAPEILLGGRLTAKCDVFSLGILLWQMRYRIMPYQILDNSDAIIYKVVKFNLRPMQPNLDLDEYALIFIKCWSRNPNDRPEIRLVVEKLKSLL